MFIRKLDFLSPPITLYYKGDDSHSSIFSGILTIIVYSICLTFGIVYAIQFVNKTNPQVCYYNRYVEDAGEFPVNSSSMFNFLQIIDTVENIPKKVDFDLITIIGLEETVDIYQENNNLTLYNHWIYGNCNNSSDIQGIIDLIKFDKFTESACIRKYYNKNDKKYYNTDEKGFKWPNILHGCSHPNRTFYGIIVEKCRNTSSKFLSDGKYCKSKEEILGYIKSNSINFQLIDQFTDILNYTTPYRKYFYSISNGLFEESYTTNHLNLNPTKLISDEGTFFESKKETLSYFFDLNEKVTSSSGNSGIYVAFYFWMQNRMQYYERVYQKVQDVLSDVGGLCSIVLTIAELINFLVCKYINLFDTQNYLNEIENSKIYGENILRLNINNELFRINVKQNSNILFPPKNNISISQHYQDDNNCKNSINNNINININNNNINNDNINNNNLYNNNMNIININNNSGNINNNDMNNNNNSGNINNNDMNNNNNSGNITRLNNDEIDKYEKQIKKIKIKKKKKKISCLGLKDSSNFKINFQNNENQLNNNTRKNSFSFKKIRNISMKEKNDSQSNENLNINNINIVNSKKINKEKNIIETHVKDKETKQSKNKINFMHYLAYLLSFTKFHSNIKIYSDFRIKMISEENLILSNLNINKILKKYKIENSINDQELEKIPKINYNNYKNALI